VNEKIYFVVDYDDKDRVLIVSIDECACLKAIKTNIEIEIELGEIDGDINEIMKGRLWTDYGYAMFDYDFNEGTNDNKGGISATETGELLLSTFLRAENKRLKDNIVALDAMNRHLKDDSKLLRKIKDMIK
jgi:hypothetical protein